MRQVGDLLFKEALSPNTGDDVDAYARSALNRYYYACFLSARDLFLVLFPRTTVPGHKDFPEIVRRKLYKRISDSAADAVASGLLGHGDAMRIRNRSRIMTASLHDLLKDGYHTRIMADYFPETRCRVNGKTLSLGSVTLDAAAKWPQRADQFCGGLRSVWRDLGH